MFDRAERLLEALVSQTMVDDASGYRIRTYHSQRAHTAMQEVIRQLNLRDEQIKADELKDSQFQQLSEAEKAILSNGGQDDAGDQKI